MLIVKIISVLFFLWFVYISFDIFKLLYVWILAFTFFIFVLIMAFHPYILKILYRLRDGLYGIIIPLTNYESTFKEQGGIIGFKDIKEEHIAIVFPEINRNVYPDINSKEKKLLYDYHTDNGETYKLYFCYQCDHFEKIVKSEYVAGLHIFGHGSISHLTFEDGIVMYREFYGLQHKKDFICQWHCNIGKYKDKHLGHIAKRCYIPDGYRHYFNNKKDIKKLIEDNLDWTINEK